MSNSNYILTSDGSFISDEELYHYGIKGMRWGIRRYQNPDGSLTAAGKRRLSKKSGDYMAPGKASNETIRRHVVFNEYRHNYDNTLQNAEDFLNKYSKATLLDLGLEAYDSSVKYVSDMFANKSELIKRLRNQEARGIELLNEKSSEINKFPKADQKNISKIVKRFSTDEYGRYVSNFKADVGGDSKADVVLYSEKGQEVISASEATKFLKKYSIEKAKEGIAKEYYDGEYSWIGKTPDSDNYYSREEFKSLITPETIVVDPKNKTYEVWWDDGGTYGYHTFTDEGSIEDMKVRYRSLNG